MKGILFILCLILAVASSFGQTTLSRPTFRGAAQSSLDMGNHDIMDVGTVVSRGIYEIGGSPIVALGANSGSDAAVALTGTDAAGTITLTTGAGSLAGPEGNLLLFSFAQARQVGAIVFLSPLNAGAAKMMSHVYTTTGSTASFSLVYIADTVAPVPDGTACKWAYHVLGAMSGF